MQAAFNFKSTRLDALLVQPQSNDAAALAAQWQQQADKYRTFAAMPLVLDLDALADAEKLDIAAVCALFKEHGFTPVALRHSKRDWEKTAAANNLLFVAADKAKAKEQAQQPENSEGANESQNAAAAQGQPESAAQSSRETTAVAPLANTSGTKSCASWCSPTSAMNRSPCWAVRLSVVIWLMGASAAISGSLKRRRTKFWVSAVMVLLYKIWLMVVVSFFGWLLAI